MFSPTNQKTENYNSDPNILILTVSDISKEFLAIVL